eukprot:CAMPEP_0204116386 /NCGR_PEP_ID=MMETSP0361-20130328/5377_1 /ASSEMBLY_ACC=CAM_ASM_000343 /TAXON_ID=268821 /ORGANISM="Scrippsiella Hangoei, Strain SHTV-5" /LENGTH=490 /DNA_ID=CAMNT_0051067169 /DNA_START=67 /DNA_END=1535 /DNA_ORIENTATION=+
MGAARSSCSDLVYLRAWTAVEVAEAQDLWRLRKPTMIVDRAAFDQVLGRRHPGVMRIFECLDKDADGRVDTFEVLLTLILWSCATWDEKLDLLFKCFDFNRKGALRFPELTLMAATAARVAERFCELPAGLGDVRSLKEAVATAFGSTQSSELQQRGFADWFHDASVAKQLRAFVDKGLAEEAPEAVEVLVRERVRMLEYRAQELAEEIGELHKAADILREAPCDKAEEAPQREALWTSFEGLASRLDAAEDSQRTELAALTASMAEASGSEAGALALLEPAARARHAQLIKELGALEAHARGYLAEAKKVLGSLLDMCRGSIERPDTPAATALPPLPAPPEAPGVNAAAAAQRLRILDRELRRLKIRQPAVSSAPLPPPPGEPPATAADASSASGGAAAAAGPSSPAASERPSQTSNGSGRKPSAEAALAEGVGSSEAAGVPAHPSQGSSAGALAAAAHSALPTMAAPSAVAAAAALPSPSASPVAHSP